MLFELTELSKIKLKNKVILSPISLNNCYNDGSVSSNLISFYKKIAQNNVGMIIVGNACVSANGISAPNELRIGEKKYKKRLKKLADTIKKFNCVPAIQLNHVGPQGNSNYSKQEVVGPSKYIVPDIGIPARELTIKEIIGIENDFEKAIIHAFSVGFEFVELHLAHGYLLHSFISEHTNKRKDIYGGSEINRFRILKNILEKVKNKIDTRKMGAKLSANDFVPLGLNLHKLKNLVKLLDKYNFAYYSISAGIYETAKIKYIKMKEGSYWDYAKKLKKITAAKIIAQGNISSIETANYILQNKMGDLIGMAQGIISDPEIATKMMEGRNEEIFKCLAHVKVGSCHRCRYLKQKDLTFDCVSPVSWKPKSYKKKIKSISIQLWKKILSEKKPSSKI